MKKVEHLKVLLEFLRECMNEVKEGEVEWV